jgi:hypothetical protein
VDKVNKEESINNIGQQPVTTGEKDGGLFTPPVPAFNDIDEGAEAFLQYLESGGKAIFKPVFSNFIKKEIKEPKETRAAFIMNVYGFSLPTGSSDFTVPVKSIKPTQLPEYIYVKYRDAKALPALSGLLIARKKYKSGMIWAKNTSKRKLAAILNVAPNTALSNRKLWQQLGDVNFDKQRNLILLSFKTTRAKNYNRLKIKSKNVKQIELELKDTYVTNQVKHQDFKNSKKATKKRIYRKRAGKTGFSMQGHKIVVEPMKLGCEKLGEYMGIKASGASKAKKSLTGVSFKRNRTKYGRMSKSSYKRFLSGRIGEKGFYRNKAGYVCKEQACWVNLVSYKPINYILMPE